MATKMAAMAPRWRQRPLDPVGRPGDAFGVTSIGKVNALDHGKVASSPRARCSSSMYRGYLQDMASYSSNGTFVLQVIFCDRSVDVLTSSWRYKGPTFCHFAFSFNS